jgi:DNA polymerase I
VTPEQHGRSFRAALPNDCTPVQRNGYTGYTFDAATFEKYREEICNEGAETSIRSAKGHRRQPYQFDGDDFIEFLGWFVTEGSVYWPRDRQTASIQIAQKTERHRRQIESLLHRMGFKPHQQENGFRFGSYLYGQLLRDLCGDDSHSKRLPDLVWSFSTEQKELLLEILLFGDGNEYGTYYTASDRLAGDVLRLCLEVGYKPRYVCRRGTWQIFVNEVNDGFDTDTHLSTELYDGLLYQLTVEDDPIVMAGRNGRFQWVGVSNVC